MKSDWHARWRVIWRRIARLLWRRNLFLTSIGLGVLVIGLMGWSLWDFMRTALAKDEKVQEFTLKGELAQFVLAASQVDGTSLLDNPRDFGPASRELSPVELRNPFFVYFLTEANAKSVTAKNIAWEPPRACSVDFVDQVSRLPDRTLRACFAVVPNDPSGRFIYFAIRYPTSSVVRHVQGEPLKRSSSVQLSMRGDTAASVQLKFEQPRLAEKRYPSQLRRFSGIHEITAYWNDRPGGALRSVKGQAYERKVDTAGLASINHVVMVGKIDASLVFNTAASVESWNSGYFRKLRIGVRVEERPKDGMDALPYLSVPEGSRGTALQSLEQTYFTFVQSRSLLEIRRQDSAGAAAEPSWSSATISSAERPVSDFLQRTSDAWANFLVNHFEFKRNVAQVEQSLVSTGAARVTLTAEPILLPDLATRAFFGLSVALIAVFLLGVFWVLALYQLNVMARKALGSAMHPSSGNEMKMYEHRRGEIGMIGRTINALIHRYRARNQTIINRARIAERRREERMRFHEEQVKARYDVMRAIGHEIKSPLQSLMDRVDANSEMQVEIEKMARAIDALYLAASVEAGLRGRKVIPKNGDLADFLRKYCENISRTGTLITYLGNLHGVRAYYDPLALDDVLSSLLDNARRHMTHGTELQVGLVQLDDLVELGFFNEGAPVDDTHLTRVFDYGFTTQSGASEHMGLGLFSARLYVLGMNGTIRVENVSGGVRFIIALPSSASATQ